jgi:hypothetical protein
MSCIMMLDTNRGTDSVVLEHHRDSTSTSDIMMSRHGPHWQAHGPSGRLAAADSRMLASAGEREYSILAMKDRDSERVQM